MMAVSILQRLVECVYALRTVALVRRGSFKPGRMLSYNIWLLKERNHSKCVAPCIPIFS